MNHTSPCSKRNPAILLLLVLPVAIHAGVIVPSTQEDAEPQGDWTSQMEFAYQQAWDSNLYLQSVTDLANISSWVAMPSLEWSVKHGVPSGLQFSASYTLAPSFYLDEPHEDHWAHKGSVKLEGALDDNTTWKLHSGIKFVDGPSDTPVYTGPGGAPCFGGLEVMGRRDGLHWNAGAELTTRTAFGFLRPVLQWKWNDFMTEQREIPGYLNYTDRADTGGGVDFGFGIAPELHAVAGYRVGYQWQDATLAVPTEYSNLYQRALLGIEGKPLQAVTLRLLAGPDFRDFGDGAAPGFDADETLFFVDADAGIQFSRTDSLVLRASRFEQPGFCGRSVYEDVLYAATWSHRFHDSLLAKAGLQLHVADFQAPANREDWITTATCSLEWKPASPLSLRLTYQFDHADSRLPNTAGREYNRHFTGVEVAWRF